MTHVLLQFFVPVLDHVAVAREKRAAPRQRLRHPPKARRVLAEIFKGGRVAVEHAVAGEHGPFLLEREHDVVGGVTRGVQGADSRALASKRVAVFHVDVASAPLRVVHVAVRVIVGANGALAVTRADALVREDRCVDAQVLHQRADVPESAGVVAVPVCKQDPLEAGHPFVLHGLPEQRDVLAPALAGVYEPP